MPQSSLPVIHKVAICKCCHVCIIDLEKNKTISLKMVTPVGIEPGTLELRDLLCHLMTLSCHSNLANLTLHGKTKTFRILI